MGCCGSTTEARIQPLRFDDLGSRKKEQGLNVTSAKSGSINTRDKAEEATIQSVVPTVSKENEARVTEPTEAGNEGKVEEEPDESKQAPIISKENEEPVAVPGTERKVEEEPDESKQVVEPDESKQGMSSEKQSIDDESPVAKEEEIIDDKSPEVEEVFLTYHVPPGWKPGYQKPEEPEEAKQG